MDKREVGTEGVPPDEVVARDERIKIGYQGALSLILSSRQQTWASFTSLLAAHALLATFAAGALKVFDARVIAMVLASLGIWLCLVWAVVIKRNLAYLDLLFDAAQDLEVSLAPEVQTVSQMRRLGQGFQVSVAGIKRTMPTLAKVFGM